MWRAPATRETTSDALGEGRAAEEGHHGLLQGPKVPVVVRSVQHAGDDGAHVQEQQEDDGDVPERWDE